MPPDRRRRASAQPCPSASVEPTEEGRSNEVVLLSEGMSDGGTGPKPGKDLSRFASVSRLREADCDVICRSENVVQSGGSQPEEFGGGFLSGYLRRTRLSVRRALARRRPGLRRFGDDGTRGRSTRAPRSLDHAQGSPDRFDVPEPALVPGRGLPPLGERFLLRRGKAPLQELNDQLVRVLRIHNLCFASVREP